MEDEGRDADLRRGDALWEQLRAVLDANLAGPVGPTTEWTGHDVYAHFGRWQEVSLATARELLAGRLPPPAEHDEDALNNRWRDEDRTVPTEVVRERCLRTRAELRELLMSISNEEWRLWGTKVAADISGEHYAHHLADAGLEPS
jgi:Mycothiol maleylpyruvate isomerase N-terminal domain